MGDLGRASAGHVGLENHDSWQKIQEMRRQDDGVHPEVQAFLWLAWKPSSFMTHPQAALV